MRVQIYEGSQYWYILSMEEKRNPCLDNNLCNLYPQVSPSSSGPKPSTPSCLHGCRLVRWIISVMLPSLRNLREGGSNVVPQERTPLATCLGLRLVKQIRRNPFAFFSSLEIWLHMQEVRRRGYKEQSPTVLAWARFSGSKTAPYPPTPDDVWGLH